MKNIMLKVVIWLENHPKTIFWTTVVSFAIIISVLLEPSWWVAAILGVPGYFVAKYFTIVLCQMDARKTTEVFGPRGGRKKKED